MTEIVTRVQFSPGKCTIYGTDGVIEIWEGQPAAVMAQCVVEAVQAIRRKLAEDEEKKPRIVTL